MIAAAKPIHLTLHKKGQIITRFLGTLLKVGWAFLWQEQFSPLPKSIYEN